MIWVILSYISLAALEGLVHENTLFFPNILLLTIFFLECMLKLLGYGIKGNLY